MNKTLAKFTYHGIHTVIFNRTPDGHATTCETCSLPAAIAAAVAFMYGHNVHRLTVDGAPLNRI